MQQRWCVVPEVWCIGCSGLRFSGGDGSGLSSDLVLEENERVGLTLEEEGGCASLWLACLSFCFLLISSYKFGLPAVSGRAERSGFLSIINCWLESHLALSKVILSFTLMLEVSTLVFVLDSAEVLVCVIGLGGRLCGLTLNGADSGSGSGTGSGLEENGFTGNGFEEAWRGEVLCCSWDWSRSCSIVRSS